MNVDEFSKYVLNNLTRATLPNTLNIANKLDNSEFYAFKDFIKEFLVSVENALLSNMIDKNIAYALYATSHMTLKKYESNFNYNKVYLINDYLIKIWKIMNKELV